VRFLLLGAPPDSNFRKINHIVVELGNLSVSRLTPSESGTGNWRAIETTEGERDKSTSSSFAPEERPESLMFRERSKALLLLLLDISIHHYCGDAKHTSAHRDSRLFQAFGKLLEAHPLGVYPEWF